MATKSGKRHAQETRILTNRDKIAAPEIAREIANAEEYRKHRLSQLGIVFALKN
jgi:hypothetical protein